MAGGACMACGAMRPLVTLCPSLMPLLPSLKAVGNTLAVSAFDESAPHEAHLQWYLVQALETPPPQPFKWSIGFMAAAPTVPYLGLRDQASNFFTIDHPHVLDLKRGLEALRRQLSPADGPGRTLPPLSPAFVAPEYSGR